MDDICHEATITKGFGGIGYMAEELSRTDFHDPNSMQYLYCFWIILWFWALL